ncbi:MAG: ParB/RepB/Spo0J family partition protein [Elusimicrobiota bacterium]|nr:ParB/RepB/Spo0J family partition protein [Elusimicrobiota bacterium]
MKKVLGKGLDSLIPEGEENNFKEIDIDSIIPNKYQMREDFNETDIRQLAETIKENGVVQPVLVTKKDDGYMLIAGERRWRASRMAGMEMVPAIERDLSEVDTLTVSLIENIQRKSLSPVEEANAYRLLIDEFSHTQKEISKKVGKSRSTVANTLRILELPDDIIEYIDGDRLTAGHARALLSIKDNKQRKLLASKIIREKITVREAEKIASNIKKSVSGGKGGGSKKESVSADIRKVEEKLSKALGSRVNIKVKKGKGKDISGHLKIAFYNMEDFDRINEVICGK